MARIVVDRHALALSPNEPTTRVEVEIDPKLGIVLVAQHDGVRMTIVLGASEAQGMGVGLIVASADVVRARTAAVVVPA